MAENFLIDLPTGTGQFGNTEFCRTIIIENDGIAEGMEDFTVQLTSFSQFVVINQPDTATVNIIDDDSK